MLRPPCSADCNQRAALSRRLRQAQLIDMKRYLQPAVRMHDPHATGIGGLTLVVSPLIRATTPPFNLNQGRRLPGSYSKQLEFPPDRDIRGNFSLVHINSFPEQPVRAANQYTCDEPVVADLP